MYVKRLHFQECSIDYDHNPMSLHDDQRGVTVFAIMLLALLVLAVVLLNGISISVKQQEQARAAAGSSASVNIAQTFCNKSYRVFPQECRISKIFQCDSQYLLETNCLGVGKVILYKSGNEKVWCDFTSFEGTRVECSAYWKTENGSACAMINNLCQK